MTWNTLVISGRLPFAVLSVYGQAIGQSDWSGIIIFRERSRLNAKMTTPCGMAIFLILKSSAYFFCSERNVTSEANSSNERALARPAGIMDVSISFRLSTSAARRR